MKRLRPFAVQRACPPASADRGGFTLVEMLVSTALVLLIMVLFAQIYGAAVGTLREQEGIAKNDAKARSAISMLRNDLGVRTFREIPLAVSDPNQADLVARGLVPIHPRCLEVDDAQRGFFYVSENDPGDDSDDVLSFTMFLRSEVGHFTGRVQTDATPFKPNHPDSDDAVQGDGVASSRAAIVTYYLRDGRLHRRITVMRDPLVIPNPYDTDDANSGALLWLPVQPSNETDPMDLGTGDLLYSASDYATWYENNAIARIENPPPPASGTERLRLLSVKSLENTHRHANGPIGLPRSREGHDGNGNPVREYSAMNFVGRPPLTGAREGEDIVLANVVGFDVKVWEPRDANMNLTHDTAYEGGQRGGRFVDLGHGPLTDGTVKGPFALSAPVPPPMPPMAPSPNSTWGRNPSNTYGPGGPSGNRIFDTWHPLAPAGALPTPFVIPMAPPPAPEAISPPYYPLKVAPNASNVWLAWNDAFPTTSTGTWNENLIYFPWAFRGDYSIGYRIWRNDSTGSFSDGTTGDLEPVWSRTPGDRFVDGGTPGGVTWECFDNRIGLTGMRITLRFVDPGSQLIRQVTLDHSFLD